jgi:hypothetical protein
MTCNINFQLQSPSHTTDKRRQNRAELEAADSTSTEPRELDRQQSLLTKTECRHENDTGAGGNITRSSRKSKTGGQVADGPNRRKTSARSWRRGLEKSLRRNTAQAEPRCRDEEIQAGLGAHWHEQKNWSRETTGLAKPHGKATEKLTTAKQDRPWL